MYVAVKGGEVAIRNAHRLLDDRRRGDRTVPALTLEQITGQLAGGGSRHGRRFALRPRTAAMAIRQARGDLIGPFPSAPIGRHCRLGRHGLSYQAHTDRRRISATYKDLPGGHAGPTFTIRTA